MPTLADTIHYKDTFFATQPILTADGHVWGYQLLYRPQRQALQAEYTDDDIATLSVIENVLSSPHYSEISQKKVCIHFTNEAIRHALPLTLPPETTVITIRESRYVNSDFIGCLRELKVKGYSLALNDYTGSLDISHLFDLIDIIFIDVLSKTPEHIISLFNSATSAVFGAKRVETRQHFEAIQNLGFRYFQGFYFEEPTIIPGRKLTSNQVAKLNLTHILSAPEPDMERLIHIIETDVSLSYRLFTYVNSVHFGLKHNISSVRRALLLLGWDRAIPWLWLAILTDLNPSETSTELAFMALVRGQFLKKIALLTGIDSHEAESWHLLGLFSMLEVMLAIPMETLVAQLPIPDAVRAALTGSCGVMCDWLTMAVCFETGDFDTLDHLAHQYGVSPLDLSQAYYMALAFLKNLGQHDD